MSNQPEPALSRRQFLSATAGAGAALVLGLRSSAAAASATSFSDDFERPDSDGWGSPWAVDGVGNLYVRDGQGVLQGATRIEPADKRVVAFLSDHRFTDGSVEAIVEATGIAAGLVLRRVGPRTHYLALYDSATTSLRLVARTRDGENVLTSRQLSAAPVLPATIRFTCTGVSPTQLTATIDDALGRSVTIAATDATAALQAPGDPGLLATSEIVSRGVWMGEYELPSREPGEAAAIAIEEASTAVFDRVRVEAVSSMSPTVPSVVSAAAGVPVTGGAYVNVVSDVPCEVLIDLGTTPDMTGAVTRPLGTAGSTASIVAPLRCGRPGQDLYWRARLRRNGTERVDGTVRRLRALPAAGEPDPVKIAIGSCAGEWGPAFASIAAEDADVFVWEGDLKYPDYNGPLMQTEQGYLGWWKEFLGAPALQQILSRAAFATQRDDHDYGGNNLGAIPQHGIGPYEAVLHPRPYYSFGGGLIEVWVLDQRRWKDDPGLPDTTAKSLLGATQREWLLTGLAESTAPFKLVCSPDPLFHPTNRDTIWGAGYTAERDDILATIAASVSGRVVWVTGDSHSGAVIERPGFLEVRASPMDTENHRASSGEGVAYSATGKFYAIVEARGDAGGPTLFVALRNADGTTAWSTTITQEDAIA